MDQITTISGPVNANAFVDRTAVASGKSTLDEVVQVINKVNEVIGGLTVVASDLDTAEVSIAAMSDHETRISVLEAAGSSSLMYSVALTNGAVLVLSEDEAKDYRVFNLFGSTPGNSVKLVLPVMTGVGMPITVINNSLQSLKIFVDGSWLTGTASNYSNNTGYIEIIPGAQGLGMSFVAVPNLTTGAYKWCPTGIFDTANIVP